MILSSYILFLFQALQLPEKVPAFGNIKQLVLSVCPFQDEDKLCWISYILKAFPLLNKLQLNVSNYIYFLTKLENDLLGLSGSLAYEFGLQITCPHKNLT